MTRNETGIRMLAIDATMRRRFYADAPAALSRRTGTYFVDLAVDAAGFLLVPAVALAGLLRGWPPAALLLFVLVTFATALACDLCKYVLARRHVRTEAETMNADGHVWVIARALAAGRNAIRADFVAGYVPAAGLIVDFVAGGFAATMLVVVTQSHGVDLWAPLATDASMQLALFATVSAQLAGTAWHLLAHVFGALHRAPLRIAAGGRGIGLLVLLFLVMAAGDGGRSLWLPLFIANAALLLLALMGVAGTVLIWNDTAWLRRHLRERQGTHRA
jgi:hypothetical protein